MQAQGIVLLGLVIGITVRGMRRLCKADSEGKGNHDHCVFHDTFLRFCRALFNIQG